MAQRTAVQQESKGEQPHLQPQGAGERSVKVLQPGVHEGSQHILWRLHVVNQQLEPVNGSINLGGLLQVT
jgi:hypothetical protein